MSRTGFDRYINPTPWDIGLGVFIVTVAAVWFYIEVFL